MSVKAPFNTKTPVRNSGLSTYRIIAARLAAMNPPIIIEEHIAARPTPGDKAEFSTLIAHDSTLDGISFIAVDPKKLASAFDSATDAWGNKALASMKEDPSHWALKASFGKTVGTGWRETWRVAPPQYSAKPEKGPMGFDPSFQIRFGSAGTPVRYTALHCAVEEIGGITNIHIDENGFVLELPWGVSLSPDLYAHTMEELLVKTDLRDWLVGKMPTHSSAHVVREIFRRISFHFPTSANGFAGLNSKIRTLRRPDVPWDAVKSVARFAAPTGMTFDVYGDDKFKVQFSGSLLDGQRTFTITLGGQW